MTLVKNWKFNVSALCMAIVLGLPFADGAMAYTNPWDNPSANMASGSTKPGYAQLSWSKGSVLPLKLRNGMVTMVSLPNGEQIADAVVGDSTLFEVGTQVGDQTMFISPTPDNMGADTNMIVTGKSGNKYVFYLRAEPSNSSEVTYSQVDIVLDNNATLPVANTGATSGGGMKSIFNKPAPTSSVVGTDGEDYGWIKSMKIDPSEFRFDLDIFICSYFLYVDIFIFDK